MIIKENNMNHGTEDLENLLKIFENMTIEEYEHLYDETNEKYGSEFSCPKIIIDDNLSLSFPAGLHRENFIVEVTFDALPNHASPKYSSNVYTLSSNNRYSTGDYQLWESNAA